MNNLKSFFNPKTIAVIGASENLQKVGGIVLQNLIKGQFSGTIFPVNLKGGIIQGMKALTEIGQLPSGVELAIIALPAEKILDTISLLADKQIVNILIFAAGFKEVGGKGIELEKQLKELATQRKLNILGPNCLGFVNNKDRVNASFGELSPDLSPLNFVSQSGALASSIFDWSNGLNLGFSQFITLGNKAVINENQILKYFWELNLNQPIGLYLESIVDGIEFIKLAKVLGKRQPLFILKPGKSTAAKKAMQSHTGSMASDDKVLDAAFREANLIRVQSLNEFFNLSQLLAWGKIPQGKRLAIITNAGGPGVIATDQVTLSGLTLAPLNNETKMALQAVLPSHASCDNPVDVLGDALAARFQKACEIVLKDESVDSLLIILTPQLMTEVDKTAEIIALLVKSTPNKPVVCSFIGESLIEPGRKILNHNHIPNFSYPEEAIISLSQLATWNERKETLVEKAIEVNPQLTVKDLKTPKSLTISSLEEFIKEESKWAYPVVMKFKSDQILHKIDVGGVIANIKNTDELKDAWNKMQLNIRKLPFELQKTVRIEMQEQILNGLELIVGVKNDPVFGKILLFGAGGTFTELIKDENLCLLPASKEQILKLIKKAKIFPLLNGYRGQKKLQIEKLVDLISIFSQSAQNLTNLESMEINPVIVTETDAYAVDLKIVYNEK